eukprot:647411-Lingulodinium_polyedra.AAC.1
MLRPGLSESRRSFNVKHTFPKPAFRIQNARKNTRFETLAFGSRVNVRARARVCARVHVCARARARARA